MTNHTQLHWQPAPQHDNGQWKGPDGYKDAQGNTYDSGHWKGFDGYKDASGKPYDSGHWQGHDAYPPHNQHDQGHWHQQPVQDVQGNLVHAGESTILPIQDPRAVVPEHSQWRESPSSDVREEHGNSLQPGDFSTLPTSDPLAAQSSWDKADVSTATLADGAPTTTSWEPIQGAVEMGQSTNDFSIIPISMA